MATSGQTLNDRINAARYALAGQGLARCVCKATTEEVIGPKKKHLDYLLACTHEPNVSIPQLANLLIERTNHIYWVVVFKALVTVHHLMSYGNERFTQYLASSNYSFELSTFLDKTATRDFSMSTFIRRYSRYINEKALSYRLLAFDFCKVKRGNEGVLRLMPIDRLLKTLPILQNQLDALLEFDCSANDLNNGVINACFMLLFRDLIGLFACHNDGIINLLNKYFTLNRKMCREAFDLYKKFLVRMDKVSDFLRVAEVVGIDKDEIPDLRRAPSSLIEALEQHLQNIESNKKILKQQPSTGNKTGIGEYAPILGNLTPPSLRRPSSPGLQMSGAQQTYTANNNNNNSQSDEFSMVNNFKDEEVRRALEEEARVLSQYGTDGAGKPSSANSSILSKSGSAANDGSRGSSNSPKFAVTTIPKSIDDIFGDSESFNNAANNNNNGLYGQLDNNGSMAFDNLSNASSSSSSHHHHQPNKQHHHKPALDSIKSTIKSATTTLEKSSKAAESKQLTQNKKASDDLFSLLETTSSSVVDAVAQALQTNTPIGAATKPSLDSKNPMSSLFAPTHFDIPLPSSNGQMQTLKPGNPFPDFGNSYVGNSSAFRVGGNSGVDGAFAPEPTAVAHPQANNSSVFKSGTSTANYTNLGGLEGFGDLLQPTSTSNNKGSGSNATFGSSKPSFNSGPGLSSTGLFKGDLDSTLANLAQNLNFDLSKTKK